VTVEGGYEMWIVAVYLVDRTVGAAGTWQYEQFHHAETKAVQIREHGFAVKDYDGSWLHYGAHRVDYIAVRKSED